MDKSKLIEKWLTSAEAFVKPTEDEITEDWESMRFVTGSNSRPANELQNEAEQSCPKQQWLESHARWWQRLSNKVSTRCCRETWAEQKHQNVGEPINNDAILDSHPWNRFVWCYRRQMRTHALRPRQSLDLPSVVISNGDDRRGIKCTNESECGDWM